ncbi:MAG: hypothetical protein ABSB19_14315 [Methylomonas sp.]|jgi:hypothetical protein
MPHQSDDSLVTETNEYGFRCNTEGNGEIYNRDSKMLWRFRTPHQNSFLAFPRFFFQLLPDFVFSDTSEKELLTIRCERRYPLTRFVMFENGSPVCTIQQKSVLQNKYIIEFDGGDRWFFHLPLFTVFYKGVSENGAEVQVRMERHHTWYVKISSNSDNLHLVAALALIHRERQYA